MWCNVLGQHFVFHLLTRDLQCGVSSLGTDIAGEKAGAMNQAQHDDLAALFAQRMNFASVEQQQQQQPIFESVPQQQQQQQYSEKQAEQPIHFISSHYNHSHHIRSDQSSDASGSPPPPYKEDLVPKAMAQTLCDNSIDPASLLPNQIHLFVNADYGQRLRLLELWRIAPPSYPLEQHLNGSLQPTSLEQEEYQAKERYEAQMQERQPPQRHAEFDTHIEPGPLSAIRTADEPAWPPAARMRAASIATSRPQTRHGVDAEPYMVNGYHEQPRSASSSSVDPVYAAASGLWQAPSYANAVLEVQSSQGMEDQYGAYMQIRNHADWEAMNERTARQSFGMVGHGGSGGGDDEMEL